MAKQQHLPNRKRFTMNGPLVYFDDRTALRLSQVFSQETEIESLMKVVFTQLQAMSEIRGMRYRFEPLGAEILCGNTDRHTAEYNLDFKDANLGTLTLFFARRQNEQQVRTCEDIIALMFTALRNAILLQQAQNQADFGNVRAPVEYQAGSSAQRTQTARVVALPNSKTSQAKTDALVLVALDDYERIRSRHGNAWAHMLMVSVHEQIRDGLRNADCVYHIGDDVIAVLLPNTTLSQAQEVAKKIRLLIASLHLRSNDLQQQFTACMGVADASLAVTAEQVMKHAREALGAARVEGSNQIVVYSERS